MKKLLLSLAAVAAFTASAETVTLNIADATDIKGTFTEEKLKDDGTLQEAAKYQPIESMVIEGYTITADKGTGTTNPAYYCVPSTNAATPATFRVYKNNEITVTAPEGVAIEKLNFTLAKSTAGAFTNNTTYGYVVEGATTDWTITYSTITNSVKFTVAANSQLTTIVVTTDGAGENPDMPEEPTTDVAIYTGLVGNADDWTIDNVTLPEELTYVWKWDSYGYMKASAYYSGAAYTAESNLISPVIDLAGYENLTVSFDQAAKFQTSLTDLCRFGVRVDGAEEINDIEITEWPVAGGWTWTTDTFDINDLAGKKVQFVFTYGASEDDGADTWEIKNFYVKGDKVENGVAAVEINENAPVEYYNLQGIRVAEPTTGLYIVRQGNKVAKQLVK